MTRGRETTGWQKAVVCLLVIQLLVIAASVASPHLHQLFHHDADRSDHECAVTVMISGGSDGSLVPQVLDAEAIFRTPFHFSSEIQTPDIAPLFLSAHVFEHAPPLC
jgi:hypothetical protein